MAFLAFPVGVSAQEKSDVGRVTGYPVPRFVTLSSGKVNLRVGPGSIYPIKWIYERRHWPLKVIAEFDIWRKVEDIDGETGWIHESLLSGSRYVSMKDKAEWKWKPEHTHVIAKADKNVIAKAVECGSQYCLVEMGEVRGWVPKDKLWGVLKDQVFE